MNLKKQQGMSALGMLMAMVLVVSAMLLAMKLVPIYINDYAIGKAVTALGNEPDLYAKSKSEVRNFMRRKLAADYTDDLSEDAIQVESRVSIIANLDIVAKFSHHLEKKK